MKRSSRKKRLAKWSKLGLSLAAVTVLGGLVEPGVADFVSPKVYAETFVNTSDQLIGVVIWHFAENTDGSSFRLNGDGGYMEVQPGQEIRSSAPNYDGYTLSHTTYAPPAWDGGDGILRFIYKQNKIEEQPEKPAGDTTSTDTPSEPQPTSSQPTVEDRYDVVTLKYRDENGEDLGEDLMMVYPTSPQRITPPAIEGYEFKEASVGENYLMYSKPISLPYEHRFAQVLTEEDLHNHSNFLGGKIKEAQDSLRDGSAYTYILNYRKTSPSDQVPVEQPEPTEKPVETPTDTPIVPLTDSPTGNDIVNSTIQLVDQDGQILQTIQQSGAEGSEVRFEFPVISGYRVGKAEGFDGWNYMKEGTFRLAANKIVKVYYDKAPSIDALIRPEQRVEYQKVFDEFHNTILKAFEVYKKELGVDDITYEANDLEKIFADSNLFVLHSELVLVQPLFAKPVGLVLTDQDIINAIGWTPEYWDHQISYHKEITQELEKAMANIAAAKATPTDKPAEPPVEQPVEQPVETPISTQPSETPVVTPADKPAETLIDPSVSKPAETPSETPAKNPAETPTNVQPSADQVGQSATEPTVLSNQDSQAGTASPTDQSAPGKQETEQETKEPAAPASPSKQSTDKPVPTSQPQAKTLPATGEAHSVWHLTGLGLLGLAGLVVKRRSRKSS
ncbi:TPA: MucBP domain-containing protein [Streptococcus suis]